MKRIFKILHITGISSLEKQAGVTVVLKGLCANQNRIDNVEAKVLSVYAKVDKEKNPFFDDLGNNSFRDYVKKNMPDIVVFHDFYYLKYAKMAFILKMMHIPYVIEPHGAFGRQAIKKSRIKKLIANNTIFRILIKGSEGFIFTNEGERADSAIFKQKTVIIPSGVAKEAVDTLDYKDFSIDQSPIFYFLGRYDINHKGLDYLFDALDILDNNNERINVRLYGVGDEVETSFIHERMGRMHNVDIEDKGTIYGDDKKAALRQANILLLTSRYEGSPMTVLDALCYGNPCIVTPGTNITDVIVENGLGWKSELDASSIADCIIKAKKDYQKKYNVYYAKCKKYVLDNALWDKIALQSINSYKFFINKDICVS